MSNIIIMMFFALIGIALGYVGISLVLKKAKESAELTLLNAQQDAISLRSW